MAKVEPPAIVPTQNLQHIWLLRLILPVGGRFNRLLTALLIIPLTWLSLWLVSPEVSRYELWFFSCLLAYLVVIFSRIIEQSQRAVDDIEAATELSAGQLAPLRHYMTSHTRLEAFFKLLGALIFGGLHIVIIRMAFDTPLHEILAHRELYASQIGTLAAWIILTAVISSLIANALAWARLGEQLEVDLLQPRAAYIIGHIAVLSTLSVIGAQVLFVLLILEDGWDWFTAFPGLVASSLPTLAMFLIPIWPLHRKLREAKKRALQRLDSSITKLGTLETLALDDAERVDDLNRLLQLRREVREASVWPFDAPNLLRLAFYLLLVPMTWVGAALVESVVDTFVD